MTTAAAAVGSLDTPAGPLALVLADDGTVLASGFGDVAPLLSRLGLATTPPEAEPGLLAPVAHAVRRYFAGDLAALDDVPGRQSGGAFTEAVWDQLRRITPGEPVTYGDLARRAGSPGAARAAGQACARNLLAPFVPCHRVVPAGGGFGGYAYGADVKATLLAHERSARGDT